MYIAAVIFGADAIAVVKSLCVNRFVLSLYIDGRNGRYPDEHAVLHVPTVWSPEPARFRKYPAEHTEQRVALVQLRQLLLHAVHCCVVRSK